MRNLLLIPFKKGESYKHLYFQRNINFTFLRFLYCILIILIGNCLIGLVIAPLLSEGHGECTHNHNNEIEIVDDQNVNDHDGHDHDGEGHEH